MKSWAAAICEGIASVSDEIILLGLSGSVMSDAAEKVGIGFASEVFADRAYEADGTACRQEVSRGLLLRMKTKRRQELLKWS